MNEDKQLKKLVQNNLMEETSADFATKLMQRITAASVSEVYTGFLWKDKLFRIIAATFISVGILLLLLNLYLGNITMSFDIKLELSPAFSLQTIQFLFVFWVVMIVNLVVSGKKEKHNYY
jgi:hypothetical protein